MYRFSARVPRDPEGYEWRNVGGYGPEDGTELYEHSMVLVPKNVDEYLRRIRNDEDWIPPGHAYDPFIEEPALFRIFAAIEPSEAAILSFANRYGDIARIQDIGEFIGMHMDWWRDAIEEMKEAVDIVDDFYSKPKKKGRETDQRSHEMIDFINELLSDVAVFLQASEKRGKTSLDSVVESLVAVTKLQLVTAIIEQKKYRNCEHCSKPFEVTPQVNRSDRLFCSDNCRVKAYQRRKRKAVDLRRSGKHLREIVKETGSDLPTVKGWVEGVRTKEND